MSTGQTMTSDTQATPEPIEDVVKRDLSGWAKSLYNCTTGDNYLRTGEWYDLIYTLDNYARALAAALSRAERAEQDAKRWRWWKENCKAKELGPNSFRLSIDLPTNDEAEMNAAIDRAAAPEEGRS